MKRGGWGWGGWGGWGGGAGGRGLGQTREGERVLKKLRRGKRCLAAVVANELRGTMRVFEEGSGRAGVGRRKKWEDGKMGEDAGRRGQGSLSLTLLPQRAHPLAPADTRASYATPALPPPTHPQPSPIMTQVRHPRRVAGLCGACADAAVARQSGVRAPATRPPRPISRAPPPCLFSLRPAAPPRRRASPPFQSSPRPWPRARPRRRPRRPRRTTVRRPSLTPRRWLLPAPRRQTAPAAPPGGPRWRPSCRMPFCGPWTPARSRPRPGSPRSPPWRAGSRR